MARILAAASGESLSARFSQVSVVDVRSPTAWGEPGKIAVLIQRGRIER
jgi:hypothetical protein